GGSAGLRLGGAGIGGGGRLLAVPDERAVRLRRGVLEGDFGCGLGRFLLGGGGGLFLDGRGGVEPGFALDMADRGRGYGLFVGERGRYRGRVPVQGAGEPGQPGGQLGSGFTQIVGDLGGKAREGIEGRRRALGGVEAEGGGEIGEGGK